MLAGLVFCEMLSQYPQAAFQGSPRVAGGVSFATQTLRVHLLGLDFWDFPDFFGFCRFARGRSGDFPDSSLFLFLGLLIIEHLQGTVPKGSATQSGPFPEKVGNPPGLEPPRFSFSQHSNYDCGPRAQSPPFFAQKWGPCCRLFREGASEPCQAGQAGVQHG